MADGVRFSEDAARRIVGVVKRVESEPRFAAGYRSAPGQATQSPVQNWVQLVSTTIAASISAGAGVVVTPASMAGIAAGINLTIGPPGTVETVAVTAITDTTFTATFANAHTGPGIAVTGAVTSGRYPGVWSQYSAVDDDWTVQGAAVWLVGANGESLASGTRYRGIAAGEVDGVMVFVVVPGGSSAAFSGASVTRSTDQTVAHATAAAVSFDTEFVDTDAYHDNSTNPTRLTIPADGVYSGGAVGYLESNTLTGIFQVYIYLNGFAISYCYAPMHTTFGATVAVPLHLIELEAGDYLEMVVNQNTGSNANLYGSGTEYSPLFWLKREG